MTKYEVLSPDGFTIEFDRPYYISKKKAFEAFDKWKDCLLYTSPSPRDRTRSRMPSSA